MHKLEPYRHREPFGCRRLALDALAFALAGAMTGVVAWLIVDGWAR